MIEKILSEKILTLLYSSDLSINKQGLELLDVLAQSEEDLSFLIKDGIPKSDPTALEQYIYQS